MTSTTVPETIPMFDVKRSRPDPLAVAIREIVPGASTSQVLDIKGLIAREAERIARSPGKRQR